MTQLATLKYIDRCCCVFLVPRKKAQRVRTAKGEPKRSSAGVLGWEPARQTPGWYFLGSLLALLVLHITSDQQIGNQYDVEYIQVAATDDQTKTDFDKNN